jgi:RND superfamily putative drug exporter
MKSEEQKWRALMIRGIASFLDRSWWICLVAWAVLALILRFTAPPWESVTQDGQFTFLPADSPSRRADELFQKSFPNDVLSSSIVVVASRSDASELKDEDRDFVTDKLKPQVQQAAGPSQKPGSGDGEEPLVSKIHAADEKGIGGLMTSADGQATLVILELTSDPFSHGNRPVISAVESVLEKVRRERLIPDGLALNLTGSAVVGRDIGMAMERSAADTEFWTILLVVGLTLVVFRAPLLALIPLITLYTAMSVALKGLALLAGHGFIEVFKGIEAYSTVVVYASGVDYGLFLISRFKEELQDGQEIQAGVHGALTKVGGAIAASAATEIAGIGMMAFAHFGKFHQAGIAISFSLLVMLVAVLTLTPALLHLTGRWAFWPHMGQVAVTRRTGSDPVGADRFQILWQRIAGALVRRPATFWFATMAVMIPFAAVGCLKYNHLNYDLVSNLPRGAASAQGTRELERHFPAGTAGPVYLMVSNPHVDFRSDEGADAISEFTDSLNDKRDELRIADIRSQSAPLGTTGAGKQAANRPLSERLLTQGVMRRRAIEYYVSDEARGGHVSRLTLELTLDPFSEQAIDFLGPLEGKIRGLLPDPLQSGTVLLISGSTASLRDLKAVGAGDRTQINLLVVGSICAILIVLLRKVAMTIYLILTVLFSYLVTLGMTYAVFYVAAPHTFSGLDWTVPLFLFTVLIAIGEDYNILLVTRIEEELEVDPQRGIERALDVTGPIISSCGIIMAGTFLSLAIAGRLAQMYQLGVALAIGVLLDTFIVRPILVPAGMLLVPCLAPHRRAVVNAPAAPPEVAEPQLG